MNETDLLEVGLQVDDANLGLLDTIRQRFRPLVRLALLQQFREVIHVLKQKSRALQICNALIAQNICL